MDEFILNRAKDWATNSYIDPEDQSEIVELIEKNNHRELTERFYKDLEFGTGGIRAILGNGLNRINKYTIRKATQALCNAISQNNEGTSSIAICYDSRKFSKEFAQEVAGVCAANNIKSYIYKTLNPVCLLSFAVRHYRCQAGIMVTASHNPPEYNGYKVYWSDGAQVTPPYDEQIINQYNSLTSWEKIKFTSYEKAQKSQMITEIGKEVEDRYFAKLAEKYTNPQMCQKDGSHLKIVYTPIHGTGLTPCKRVLKEMGFNHVYVPSEQAEPDHRFPTVKSPNPENPDALKLAIDLMKKEKADIVFGTDPDTDRLGVAIEKSGQIFFPNGNQIGVLMLHYILTNLKERNELPENPYFVKTIVTTDLQKKIAEKFGVTVENTLTGFKWICGMMKKIEENSPERNFIFATEESFGYMNHDFVRDKDGICSVALMAELTLWYKLKGMDIVDALDKIYEEYGLHQEQLLCLDYEGKAGAEKIQRIMNHFREHLVEKVNDLSIGHIEDFLSQKKIDHQGKIIGKIDLPKSNVLGYSFQNGDKLYLRPSGTEPKIKFYIMINVLDTSLEESKQTASEKIESMLTFIKTTAERC